MMNFQVFAILPAGGSGQRTGLDTPKQFCDVLGRPLIVYTLECFERITWIEKILVAIAPDWEECVNKIIDRYKLTKVELVYGGTSRHRSIKNCVEHLRDRILRKKVNGTVSLEERDEVVIVHDAVRPFADEDILKRVTLAANQHGAAGAVLPLVSTTIESDSQDVLVQSLVRSKFKESHTPQAFTWSTLQMSYQQISEHDLDHGTEVLDLAFRHAGCRAKLVEAPDYVWKVTYKKDFIAAESFAKVNSSEVYLISKETQTQADLNLKSFLASQHLKVITVSSVPSVFRGVHVTIVLHLVKPSPEEVTMKCEQSIDSLASKSCHGGLLACLCHISDDDDKTLRFYRRLAKRLAGQGEAERVCAFIIVCVSTPKKEQQLTSRACEMTASLVYDRNQLMSGQLFIISELD